jgi:GNAT superfamily N-acetyltransferase
LNTPLKSNLENKMEIVELNTEAALEQGFSVLSELREDLTLQNYLFLFAEAKRQNNYRLVGILEAGKVVAVMGYRILFDFAHGKHLYIDDLVVTKDLRSSGLGGHLLEFAEREAHRHECAKLRLCTGIDRLDAQRFYESNGWEQKSFAFKKLLSS